MLTEEGFERLGQHLQPLWPVFQEFCAAHGFDFVAQTALGRYPRIRINKRFSELKVWFELWMCCDDDGNRFEEFFDEIPYELSCGAFADLPDNRRYSFTDLIWDRKPFSSITDSALRSEMELKLPDIEDWDINRLREKGRLIQLG